MINKGLKVIDWFVPERLERAPSDLALARNFVFTHLMGPVLGQSIAVFLYFADPAPNHTFWIIESLILVFWALPLALKFSKSIAIPAFISVQTLTFLSLYGSFHYGGVSSPFLPWFLIALLLGFFYLARHPFLVIGFLVVQLSTFFAAYLFTGYFPERVPVERLAVVGLVSCVAAMIYMWWMAVFYCYTIAQNSSIQHEAERHRATAELLQEAMRRAEKANHAKSVFLAKMNHELRTPLNAVIGYSALIREEVEVDQGAESALFADISQIHTAGQLMLHLVDKVLDLGEIETKQTNVVGHWFALRQLVDEVIVGVRPAIAANGNNFILESDADLGDALTDATKLKQCLLNLLSNAAKFTHKGDITLVARRDRTPAGDWVRLQVRDTGIGIAQENLDSLFKNFGQATSAINNEFGGTGLGLAISQDLCAQMGGSITVESQPGKGSVFTINLPAILPDAALPTELAA